MFPASHSPWSTLSRWYYTCMVWFAMVCMAWYGTVWFGDPLCLGGITPAQPIPGKEIIGNRRYFFMRLLSFPHSRYHSFDYNTTENQDDDALQEMFDKCRGHLIDVSRHFINVFRHRWNSLRNHEWVSESISQERRALLEMLCYLWYHHNHNPVPPKENRWIWRPPPKKNVRFVPPPKENMQNLGQCPSPQENMLWG